MNLSSLRRAHCARLSFMLVLVTFGCLRCADGMAQVLASDQAVRIDTAPSQNPWKQLGAMPSKLGRFVLASDRMRIYQMGGISFNIRRGQHYGHQFAAYDPSEQKWEKLPNVPHGTGGAHLAWWPANDSLVMIGGIKKLGDRFSSHGITIGTYAIAEKRWESQVIRCRGLGRVAAMIHLDEDRFLLIAGDDDLHAQQTAILEMEAGDKVGDKKPVATLVGKFSKGGRILGIARTADTVSVLQGDSPDATRLQRFSAASGEHLDSVDLSANCNWTDKLFAWRGNLLIWKNADASQPQSYRHASQLLLIDPETGACQKLHPGHPGPLARRSADGIVCGDALYVFGGQDDEETWLNDAHRYRFFPNDTSATK